MKKTIAINLGGVIFNIDEDAYHLLGKYLESLRIHFGPDESVNDILNDIESRIAEILQGKTTESKKVITIEDIREVMKIMGTPGEIDSQGEPEAGEAGPESKGLRRFYRDPERRIIAGVCAGIAAWLRLDPIWIRLVFILTILAGGSGGIIYLILWVVMPEAKTTSDRLMMRGEKVTVGNIEKSIREELGEIRKKLGEVAGSGGTGRNSARRGPGLPETVLKGIGEILRFAGKVLRVVLGISLLMLGITLMIAVLALTFGWGGAMGEVDGALIPSFPSMARLIFGCDMDIAFLELVTVIVLGIPVIMLLYNGIRLVFRIDKIRHFAMTLFNIWVVGVIIMAFLGFRAFNLLKSDFESNMQVPFQQPAGDTLYLAFAENEPLAGLLDRDIYHVVDDVRLIRQSDSSIAILPRFYFPASDDSNFRITTHAYSRGRSVSDARARCSQVRFPVTTRNDTLFLPPVGIMPGNHCWRGEKITLRLEVPAGKKIIVTGRVSEIVPDYMIPGGI